MDNQHQKIRGYRDLTQDEIDGMNRLKEIEAKVNGVIDITRILPGVDQRLLSIAVTHLETAFMFAVKSIARPERQVA